MKKYPKIKRIGHSSNDGILESGDEHLFAQEKVDGANFRFTLESNIEEEYLIEGRDIVFGSRNVVYKNERDIDSNFTHAVEWVRDNIDLNALKLLDDTFGPLTFYGEALHSHTIDYNWDSIPNFVGFDVHSESYENMAAPDSMEDFYERIGLPSVPHVEIARGDDGEFVFPQSLYYDGKPEGIVIKNQETGQRAKVRTEQFKEAHSSAGGKNPGEYEPDDNTVLAHKFATEARVIKMIHKYENSGRTIEMGVMEDLWCEVFDDIIDEEYDTIFHGNYDLDTAQFRSEVASRTADILETYLSRPDDSVLNEASA